jgi:serine/threonine protein kinase
MLNHPNIVTVYEIGASGAVDFVASELVDGVMLRERLAAGPLSIRDLVDIGGQICAALSTAHGAGIVHRDLKPENVMIRRDGIVKVVDFGLAMRTGPEGGSRESIWQALTQSGVVAGTASYMSPEQALGEPIDQRSDLFSIGILLYEMATAQRPFAGASDAAMYEALLHAAPPAPSTIRAGLPMELDLVIGRALEKDRDCGISPPPISRPISSVSFVRRHRRDWRLHNRCGDRRPRAPGKPRRSSPFCWRRSSLSCSS